MTETSKNYLQIQMSAVLVCAPLSFPDTGIPLAYEPASPERTVGHALIAVAAFLYSAWAILGAGKDAVYWGSLLLLAGIPVFVWLKRPSAQRSPP